MSFSIVDGYLLSRKDYDVFDEIIVFLSSTGNIFPCISKGSRKIKSKNARNLFYGKLSEFEFFSTRKVDGMSKLMRVKIKESHSNISWNNAAFYFINEAILKMNLSGKKLFTFYDWISKNSSLFLDEYDLINFSLIHFIRFAGVRIYLNKCSICGKKKISNFINKKFGFVCKDCDDQEYGINLAGIYYLFNLETKKFENLNKISIEDKINCLKALENFIFEKIGINLYSLVVNF